MRKSHVIAIIALVVVALGTIAYAAKDVKSTGLDKILPNAKTLVPEVKPREPIVVYRTCTIGYEWDSYRSNGDESATAQYITATCKEPFVKVRLNIPNALHDVNIPYESRNDYKNTLYKYSDKEYAFTLNDGVSTKTYSSTVWELP